MLLSIVQLIQYLAVATRPQASGPALPMAAAIADVQELQAAFNIAEDGPGVFGRLLQLLATQPGGGKQVHDANLVATMLEHRITRLLTFNDADFRRFVPLDRGDRAMMSIHDEAGGRKYLTGAEHTRFLQAADLAPRDVRAFCHTLAWSGCRISEALALTGERVDVAAGTITFETLKKR